mmetsp:Transcript_14587/g.22085  ORF Transcript_14587/g.22085 Transcript_14587/m.22085 type:complete len:611 (+) Transcript_14587:252-2084(+)|eukprot:CAMPEP_0203674020 /NCGR_PEP_ID=MMETSP0090-20130426/14606_1 /ASSEMBLY_ACC=CAM_ASM_001088 /TAXON_ID=426623 /ORGANISM="Chaetoceros affinis, Strain CCMP159" /LENGTH=610 /DNA_ID=CAMNT_0050539789 /DNA_START=230 /DNA_END=2062 /DNA_ORIENTATION=-
MGAERVEAAAEQAQTQVKARGTYLVIEPKETNEESAPTYIHCNSQTDFILPPPPSPVSLTSRDKEGSTCTSSTRVPLKLVKVPITKIATKPNTQQSFSSTVSSSTTSSSTTSSSSSLSYSAKEVNKSLNLHLGLPVNPRDIKLLRLVCKIMSFFLGFVEQILFRSWDSVPLRLRQTLALKAWNIYFPMHKLLLSNKTGIHPNASYEYHAMTTILYWGRLFPVTIARMRFSLSQLCCCHGVETYPLTKSIVCTSTTTGNRNSKTSIQKERLLKAANVHVIQYDMAQKRDLHLPTPYKRVNAPPTTNQSANENKVDPTEVTGYIIQHNHEPSKKILLWLYGGAYLSGDSKGNLNFAEKIGQQCDYMDVFLPNYRLLPEYTFFDAIYDVCLAYEYLITVRGYHPKDVMLFGISSGGGLLVRLLQRIVEFKNEMAVHEGDDHDECDYEGEIIISSDGNQDGNRDNNVEKKKKKKKLLQLVPSGALLMCPFVDYTKPKGSFIEYIAHDLIVNESVFEEGEQYLQTLGSEESNRRESPVHRSCKGLPPLCIITSEHECVYDQDILLCNNARRDGVRVDLGLWKYMCHVWPVWSGFIPESRQAVDFMCDWMKEISSS